jgi:hypothetical protein
MTQVKFRTPPSGLHLTKGGGGGGSGIPLTMQKTTFPNFCQYLHVLPCHLPDRFLGKRGRILKIREIFFSEWAEEQKPLSVFATELRAERFEDIFEAYFSIFSIARFSPDLAGAVTASWDEFGEIEGDFCPAHAHIQ